jgi:uncharacterized protein (DUF2147 family)
MKKAVLILIAIMFVWASMASAGDADAILGQWYIEGERAVVEMYRCADRYCGRIVWLKEPKNADGSDKMDIHNPDPSKKRCPVVGINIVRDFEYKGKDRWADGEIYDPDNGKSYSCKMTLAGDTLKVRGFIGISLIGRTTQWTRKL